ncbi:uncharacterized protein LOC143930401 isoform X3 [Lithobates pipiens]
MHPLRIAFFALIFGFVAVRTSQEHSPNVTSLHCVFPFNYESHSFTSCIPNGRRDRAYWCSKTQDYARDLQFELCTASVAVVPGNSRLWLALPLCLGVVILFVCIAGCCMKVQWRGIQSGLWWSSRRQVLKNGTEVEDASRPESIYENIEYKDVKDTTPI